MVLLTRGGIWRNNIAVVIPVVGVFTDNYLDCL